MRCSAILVCDDPAYLQGGVHTGVKFNVNVFVQGLAESNQIFTGSIDAVVNMLVKNFDCCFLRQILTTVMLKIEKYGLRVLIWAEVQPLIDVLLPKSRP